MPEMDKFIDTLPEFVLACEGRPRVVVPSNQWLWGSRRQPFRPSAVLKNGAVTSSDLTTQDAWFDDVQVKTAYTPTDGSTTKLRAVLSIEAVRVLVADGTTFYPLDISKKIQAALGLSLRIDIGGVTKRIDLRDSIRELPREFQQTQAAAANGTFGLLKGDWAEVGPGSISVDLEQHTLILESTNSVAYGADVSNVFVEFIGHMVPKGTPGAFSYIPGGSAACGPHGNFAVGGARSIGLVSGLPALRGLAING